MTPVSAPVDGGTARLLPDVDRPRACLLTVDGAPQSYVDLDEPAYLEFEYVRRLAHALDLAAPDGEPLEVLHLGGGGLTLPRYLAAARPGSRQCVAEADAPLAALVARHLPLPAGSGVHVEVGDGRAALEASGPVDVVVADVFTGSRVPGHLATLGYARAAARALRPGGLYAANLADGAPLAFLGSQLATFATVFDHVAVVAEPSVLRGRRFGNVQLLASAAPLPLEELARRCAADAFPARVEHGPALRRRYAGRSPVQDEDAVSSPEPPAGAFGVG